MGVHDAGDGHLRTSPPRACSPAKTSPSTGPRWRHRSTLDYHGYTVCKAGPWSQGPVFLQQLALLDGFDLTSMGHNTPDFVHTVVECAKLAFADREAWYGDPDFVDVPLAGLLDPAYAEDRRALVGEDASFELRPGAAGGRDPRLPDRSRVGAAEGGRAGAGEPTVPRDDQGSGDTTHLDVVDRHGNMVSATPSGGWLQSSPVVPGLGFCLTTRAQMFRLDRRAAQLAWRAESDPAPPSPPRSCCATEPPYLAFGTPEGTSRTSGR